MEKNQGNMKKKNMSIKIVTSRGGGGLAGIILLGGALAAAALISTFAFKRKQKSKKCDEVDSLKKCSKVVKKDGDELFKGDGLSFLVDQDYLSPQLNHQQHPSNGTQDEFVSREIMILDETSQVNGEKDEEIDILKKARESLLCDESVTGMEEFPVPFADSSLLRKPEETKKNDRLEENAGLKVDEKIVVANSNKLGVVDNDQHILLKEDEVCDGIGKFIDGNNKLAEAALADQVGVDGKEHMPAGKCKENREVIIEREGVLVEVPQSEQPGISYDYYKLGDECDGTGQVLVEKREELVEAAVVNKIRADDNPFEGGEECDADEGITIKKGEELVGDVAANGIQLSEKLEFTAMCGDQDILCYGGTINNRHENGTCDIKMTDLLFSTDSSLLLKPADNDLVENSLVVEDTKIVNRGEADETAVQEDSIKVEDGGLIQLVEANEDNKIYGEFTNDKWEGSDEIKLENDQQMQPCEEFQKNHISEDKKYSSNKSSPEINSFPSNAFEVQEFSFPLLDSPPYFSFRNLIKDDYSETALHVEDVNTMKKDRLANGVFAYQTVLENTPLVQSAKNNEMKSFNDGSENDVAEGEATLETGLVDIGGSSINDEEALEIIQTENFELENNQRLLLNEDNCYDNNVNREEVCDSSEDEENSDSDCDEEDTDDEDEESSETTGGSSVDSNAEAIWPVESVQEFSQNVKDIHANNHNFMETGRKDSYANLNIYKPEEEEKDNFDMGFSNKLTAEITTLRQPTNLSILKFWFLLLLVPFLLLLWLLSSQMSFPSSSHFHLQ